MMIAPLVAMALSVAPACPITDARANLLALHESARQAHLKGEAGPLAAHTADRLLLAENGSLRVQTKAQVSEFFAGYFKRVRYREWRDVSEPVVRVSPDGRMAWMAVAVEARYSQVDKPAEGEKGFKSSWIATYERDGCAWLMTGIASDIIDNP